MVIGDGMLVIIIMKCDGLNLIVCGDIRNWFFFLRDKI